MGSNPIRVIYGGLAQLGEHLPYKQRVGGSNPSASTIISHISFESYGEYTGIINGD